MTCDAPAARATPMANRPIGPQPVTAMRQADRSPANAVCTALPSGSMMLCTSMGMFSGARQALLAGTATYSAKPPLTSTPKIFVFSQTWPLPVRQAIQCPHTMWLSHETRSPSANSVTPAPHSTISPTNSWPNVTGGLMRPCDQRSQVTMCRSVPHTPARNTRSNSCPGCTVGTGTSWISAPGAAFDLTIAFMVAARVPCAGRGVPVVAVVVAFMGGSRFSIVRDRGPTVARSAARRNPRDVPHAIVRRVLR